MEVLAKAAVLVAIIAAGYGVKRLRWVAASDFNLLSASCCGSPCPARS